MAELGALSLELVTDQKDRHRWEAMIETHHPQGWSAPARFANIQPLVCNHRFLIIPTVRVYGLASHVLHMATHRVAADWMDRYAVKPWVVYSHVGLSIVAIGV